MESDFLLGFRRGDRGVLEDVYRAHLDAVERLIRHGLVGLGRLSAANLEDVVQEVFLRAFSPAARASYDGQREYAPYILTIARHVLIDWAKRHGRELPLLEVTPPGGAHEPIERNVTDAEETTTFDSRQISLAARYVETLPAQLRAVHHQRFVKAESQRRAADILGISRQNLRTLEKELIKGLRRELRRAGLQETATPQPATFTNPPATLAGKTQG